MFVHHLITKWGWYSAFRWEAKSQNFIRWQIYLGALCNCTAWSCSHMELGGGACVLQSFVSHTVTQRAITAASERDRHTRFPYSLCATEHSSCGRRPGGSSSPIAAFHANSNNTPGIASFSCQVKILKIILFFRSSRGFVCFLFFVQMYSALLGNSHRPLRPPPHEIPTERIFNRLAVVVSITNSDPDSLSRYGTEYIYFIWIYCVCAFRF